MLHFFGGLLEKAQHRVCGSKVLYNGLWGRWFVWEADMVGFLLARTFLGCFYFGGKFNTVSSNLGTNLDEMKPLRGSQGTEKEVCNNYHGCVTGCVAKCL